MSPFFYFLLFYFCFFTEVSNISNWISDNGDGTYKNPIIFADYSDPDVIRVDDDFYLVSSSFSNFPGIPVLHSKDLINWKIINHAIDKYPFDNFKNPQHGNGIWAPSIRYHNNQFYIYFGDPDNGIFMVKTKNPWKKWSSLIQVKKAKGWIDPCPFWDDDGNSYLVHAWAKSRAGFNDILTVNKMNKDGTKVVDEGKTVFNGNKSQPTIEGPKFYKRNNYYYIFAPAGGVQEGWQTVLRSRNIYGPYTDKIVLDQGNTNINGPHQGAWIKTQNNESWFIHFQDKGAYGRVVLLEPMKWVDNWPVIGIDKNNDGKGEPVLTFSKPDIGKSYPIQVPQTSDQFDSTKLGLQWQWEANYSSNWISLKDKKGWLRFYSQPLPKKYENFWNLSYLLMQKFPSDKFTVTTKLKFNPKKIGEKTGLLIFGLDYSYISIEKIKNGYKIYQAVCINADKGENEKIIQKKEINNNIIYLRVNIKDEAVCNFSYSFDGKNFKEIGKEFKARQGKWVGAKVGLFSLSPKSVQKLGYTDFDWFKFE